MIKIKKIIIVGLSLLFVIFAFTSSNYIQSVDIRKDRYLAQGLGNNSPAIDFTEVFEDGKFTKAIINNIKHGENVYNVYMVTKYGRSNTNFSEYSDSNNIRHHFAWKDGCCWWLDTADLDYYITLKDGSKAQVLIVEFGQCNCLCNQKTHFVINFKTSFIDKNGGYAGYGYICSVSKIE